jgi:hypothetical protein
LILPCAMKNTGQIHIYIMTTTRTRKTLICRPTKYLPVYSAIRRVPWALGNYQNMVAWVFFAKHYTTQTLTNMYIHSTLCTHACTLYSYKCLWRLSLRTDLADLEIDEVTMNASLSTGTSPSTERIFHFFIRHQSVKPVVWFLVGLGCHYPPYHPARG